MPLRPRRRAWRIRGTSRAPTPLGVSGPVTEAACGSVGPGVVRVECQSRSRSHVSVSAMRRAFHASAEPTRGTTGSAPGTRGREAGIPRCRFCCWPEPRRSGPILRLFTSSDPLPGAERLCGRGSWQGRAETTCPMRFSISSNLAIRTRNGASDPGEEGIPAAKLRLAPTGYAEYSSSSVPRTCLSRPDTECNLMTEWRGVSKRGSERRSAPLSTSKLTPPHNPVGSF